MFRRFTLLAVLSLSRVCGQVAFTPGLPGDSYCPLPVNPCRNGATCLYTDNSVVNTPTLLYGYGGFPFTCTIPVSSAKVDVVLGFYEPNKTGTGQRVFNVSVNGGGALTVDVFAIAGLKKYVPVTIPGIQPVNGIVRISFTGVVGNPLVSTIALNAVTPPPPPSPPTINEKSVSIKPLAGTTVVTIPEATFIPESLDVAVNGLTMTETEDYIISGVTITFLRVFQTGDLVRLKYRF